MNNLASHGLRESIGRRGSGALYLLACLLVLLSSSALYGQGGANGTIREP